MFPLKIDKGTGLIIAAVIFLLSAWLMGSLFYTITDVTGEGTAPGYSSDELQHEGGRSGTYLSPWVWRVVRWVVLITLSVVLVVGGYLHIMGNRRSLAHQMLSTMAPLAIALLFVISWRTIVDFIETSTSFESGSGGGFSAVTGTSSSPGSSNLYLPLIILLVLGVLLLVKSGLTLIHKPDKEDVEKDVSETIDRTLKDLYRGKDSRSAIIRCYIEMSEHLQEKGVDERDSFTPREFRARAAEKLALGQEPLFILTSMFEKARYSHHPLEETEKRRAIESLESLKRQLEVVL